MFELWVFKLQGFCCCHLNFIFQSVAQLFSAPHWHMHEQELSCCFLVVCGTLGPLRTVTVEILWFTSYSSCCLLSGWADVFSFRISDLCYTLAYHYSSVLKSWLVLCSIISERCSLVSLARECEKPDTSTWSVCCQTSPASAANDLQCVWNSQE